MTMAPSIKRRAIHARQSLCSFLRDRCLLLWLAIHSLPLNNSTVQTDQQDQSAYVFSLTAEHTMIADWGRVSNPPDIVRAAQPRPVKRLIPGGSSPYTTSLLERERLGGSFSYSSFPVRQFQSHYLTLNLKSHVRFSSLLC